MDPARGTAIICKRSLLTRYGRPFASTRPGRRARCPGAARRWGLGSRRRRSGPGSTQLPSVGGGEPCVVVREPVLRDRPVQVFPVRSNLRSKAYSSPPQGAAVWREFQVAAQLGVHACGEIAVHVEPQWGGKFGNLSPLSDGSGSCREGRSRARPCRARRTSPCGNTGIRVRRVVCVGDVLAACKRGGWTIAYQLVAAGPVVPGEGGRGGLRGCQEDGCDEEECRRSPHERFDTVPPLSVFERIVARRICIPRAETIITESSTISTS